MSENYGNTIIAKDVDGEARIFNRNTRGEWVESDHPDYLPRYGDQLYCAHAWSKVENERVQEIEYNCEMFLMQSYLAGHLWRTPAEALRKLEIDRLIAATASHRLLIDEYGTKEDYDTMIFYNLTTHKLQVDDDSGDNARFALAFRTIEEAEFFIDSVTPDEFLKFVALVKHKDVKEIKKERDTPWN